MKNKGEELKPKSKGKQTPLPSQEQKLRNKLAFEAKKRREETHFVLNPDCPPPKVFLHERKV